MSMAEPISPQSTDWTASRPGQGTSAGPATSDPERLLPEQGTETYRGANRITSTAESIGNAVGTAVERVKQLPQRLQDMKKRFTVIRGRAQDQALDKASELKNSAAATARQARNRAERMAHENPLAFIAGAALLGAVLGVALRIWRDSRE